VIDTSPGGGDCARIGTWAAPVCTLDRDVHDSITLAADGIVLDGAGHVVSPVAGPLVSIAAEGRARIEIRNVKLGPYWIGIHLSGGGGHVVRGVEAGAPRGPRGPLNLEPCAICLENVTACTVAGNRIRDATRGIVVTRGAGCEIAENTVLQAGSEAIGLWWTDDSLVRANAVEGPGRHGIRLIGSTRNRVVESQLADLGSGIELDGAQDDLVMFNIIASSDVGVMVVNANGPRILCNDLADGTDPGVEVLLTPRPALVALNNFLAASDAMDFAPSAVFELPAPVGGNHWERDRPVCRDLNGDGFCDRPHPIANNNQDALPRLQPVAWRIERDVCHGAAAPGPPPEQQRDRPMPRRGAVRLPSRPRDGSLPGKRKRGRAGGGRMREEAGAPEPRRNVLGEPLAECSSRPRTGFYRNGCCDTGPEDVGSHTVCAVMTEEFLAFSRARGNDLSTPRPEYAFPGLQPGDRWCLCAPRWQEALLAGKAPRVVLAATHRRALDWCGLEDLKRHAVDLA
jgi:parallel beta-helix repeat protein